MSHHSSLLPLHKKKQIWISIPSCPYRNAGPTLFPFISLSLFFFWMHSVFIFVNAESDLSFLQSSNLACLFSWRRSRRRLIFTIGMVGTLRLLYTILLTGVVTVICIKCGACCLVAHMLLAIRRRAGIGSVSLTVGRLLVATLVVSRLVVVHLVGCIVFVVSSRLALGSASSGEPASPVHGLHAAPTVSSCNAPIAKC